MTSQQIQKKLEIMKGKSYEYAKQVHFVKSYIINSDEEWFEIKTDINSYKRKFVSAKEFFSYWFEQAQNMAIEKSQNHLPQTAFLETGEAITKTNSLADDLVEILKENIKKVSANPAYVNQAKAVDKSVDTIIKVKKMQLELYKAVNTKNKRYAV